MNREELRQQIAETLWRDDSGSGGPLASTRPGTQRVYASIAGLLLPLAEQYAAERVAEGLEAAARSVNLNASPYAETFYHWLMARAEDARAEVTS